MNRSYRARNQEQKDYNTRKMAALGKGVSWWWWWWRLAPPQTPLRFQLQMTHLYCARPGLSGLSLRRAPGRP